MGSEQNLFSEEENAYDDELVEQLTSFFEKKYLKKARKSFSAGKPLLVDFADLDKYSTKLSDALINRPDEWFEYVEEAINKVDLDIEGKKTVRVFNLPEHKVLKIKNLRSEHLKKFVSFEGIIKQASEVRPEIIFITFTCPACNAKTTVIQEDTYLKKPYVCECGNKRGFTQTMRKLRDVQRLEIEELPEKLEGGAQPRKLGVFLRDDLVDPLFQRSVVPGSKVNLTGILRDMPMRVEEGKETRRRDIFLEANYLFIIEHEFEDIEISKEEEKKIKEYAADPEVYANIVKSIAPSIYGHEKIKEAIMYQLFGGSRKERSDGVTSRGDIHIFLVGDPGGGKSQILKYVSKLAPKARYIVGKSTTGAGITATVVKDEFMRGWALEAGALVLANKGMALIDELDKMSKEDRSAMHEALEQQTITISKANIQATLQAQTTVLAAANPKFGRFDPNSSIVEQIDIPDTLLSRFDLIFAIRDIPDKKRDSKLVKHILRIHEEEVEEETPIERELLRKYIAYAKIHMRPKLMKDAMVEIEKFYVTLRNKYASEDKNIVPIGARQLEALIRLSEASAKIRLSEEVTKEDAKQAIKIVRYCLTQIGVDPETGEIDIDRMEGRTSSAQRNKLYMMLKIIEELQGSSPQSVALMDDVIEQAENEKISRVDAEIFISKLKQSGDIYEPSVGKIKRL
ncbi:MAG: minichromosome maintenance protein MCM [Candidatus Aenigmarchaeota archaeon]|nr:minichromosome maintenance protein MCM [Candidatus Aenigmarchaeota archaeon]